jgi:hypothetical protein
MSLAITAAILPLFAIAADDPRLQTKRTFVSEAARAELAQDSDERVLCLDRKSQRQRYRSICLTEAQWREAIALAEAQPKTGGYARDFIPVYESNLGLVPPPSVNP